MVEIKLGSGGGGGSTIGKLFGGLIFLILIAVILSVIGVTAVSSSVTSLIDGSLDIFEIIFAGNLPIDIEAEPNELICDLKIEVFAVLKDSPIPLAPAEIGIGSQNPLDNRGKLYQWKDCQTASRFPIGSLIDLDETLGKASLLSFVFQGTETVVEIQLVDRSTGKRITSDNEANFKRTIDIPLGIVPLPHDLTDQLLFVTLNIPAERSYDLEVTFEDFGINGQTIGRAYKDRICAVGLMTC